jgi:peptidoglycan glycosyltransferase
MATAVAEGFGAQAAPQGVKVGGKTGTAEIGAGEPTHAWFIGFAPVENPTVAVAVIVERGGAGGTVAAPVAREVFRAALQRQ